MKSFTKEYYDVRVDALNNITLYGSNLHQNVIDEYMLMQKRIQNNELLQPLLF